MSTHEQSHNSVTESRDREEQPLRSTGKPTRLTLNRSGNTMQIRSVVARNLQYLMDLHLERGSLDLASRQRVSFSIKEHAKKTLGRRWKLGTLSAATIDNVMWKQTAISIDNLEKLAAAFNIPVYYLLVPGLDLRNPPRVVRQPAPGAAHSRYLRERRTALKKFFELHGGPHELNVGQEGMEPYGSQSTDAHGDAGGRLSKRSAPKRPKKANSK